MKLKSYNADYLPHVSENLGTMLEYAVNCGYSARKFWTAFANSYVARQIEAGNPRFLIGCSAIDLFNFVVHETENNRKILYPRSFNDRLRFYWGGWSLAQYQHYSGLSFAAIDAVFSMDKVLNFYEIMHEMDIYKFFEMADKYIHRHKTQTNLAKIRKAAGLSQKRLAKEADISIRSVQSYEQGDNDINKAQAIIVFRLARALGCAVEDLLEYS